MALSNLTSLTQSQYDALSITPFPVPPGVSSTGNPDRNVGIQLGGWVGTDVLAFKVNEAASTGSSINIDASNTNTLDVNVTGDNDPTAEITYWTVNMGTGASGSNWEISFAVETNNTNTGTWKFVKGKSRKF